jgi:DNA-binding transcriptional regulator/RsmH inhibitor MraZ
MDELFIGSAICEVTSGGEIVLPRPFHETALARTGDGRLLVGLHEESPCLTVYDRIFAAQQQWDFETRRSSFLGTNMDAHYARLRRAFGFVEQVTLAPDGMMVLAPLMRQRGGIGSAALLVATGARFEIWDLDLVLERAPIDLVTLATFHLKLQIASEECHGPSLHAADPRRHAARIAQSGLRLQHMPTLRPRHDPVGGPASEQVEGRSRGFPGHLEKY